MASIISSTHKTYDNLKRIESVMSGVVKSKRLEKTAAPTTPIPKYRSKSAERDVFFYPRANSKLPQPKFYIDLAESDSRTIKKSKDL
jgi:hypothetical protein